MTSREQNLELLKQNISWSIKATKKPQVEDIDYEREEVENHDQDFALNRQLLKRIEVSEGVFTEIKDLIKSGHIKDHLSGAIAQRVQRVKDQIIGVPKPTAENGESENKALAPSSSGTGIEIIQEDEELADQSDGQKSVSVSCLDNSQDAYGSSASPLREGKVDSSENQEEQPE